MKDFSLNKLKQLYEVFLAKNYTFIKFVDYWKKQDNLDKEKFILLRHDVDRFPKTAMDTAILENSLGITGTYFFRIKPHTFKKDIIQKIANLGHEIGYHYETLADSSGNYEKAKVLFNDNLTKLRQIAQVSSCSMHSRPLSQWDNRLLFDKYPLDDFKLLGETYRSINHTQVLYLADSGRNWGADRNVVWDSVEGIQPPSGIKGTDSLINAIYKHEFPAIQLLIHPNRWPAKKTAWVFQKYSDLLINMAKTIVKFAKKSK